MRVAEGKHTQLGSVPAEQLRQLWRGRVGHPVVGFVAVGERVFQGLNQVSLGRLRLLNTRRRWTLLTERRRTEQILRVRHVSDQLSETANIIRRLESVVTLRHFI